ncbi:MAG TPA: bifunctional DNA-formamidopyrimidine glycosylase/DNA-(apurinic or apyrimidinic site) lyase [Candidatus Cloacimonadota bacterium]|nr:bifunctional DNA-formamidopyrimidine glycosylase/DNA-(apurinic or apyrimidinic site) lyase [Candidatus Cloacimonadota bacterium]
MPELPEVQTIVTGLQNKILPKEIREIIELRSGTIIPKIPITKLGRIDSISRRGKYIIIHTSEKYNLVIHLRMTGKLILESALGRTSAHARAEIIFTDDTKLIFDDVRTFGKIQIMRDTEEVEVFCRLGAEPLSGDFHEKYLAEKLHGRKAPIKNVLLDQSVIAGLGNIYVSEILFRCKIDPRMAAEDISTPQIGLLVEHTKKVLQEAIAHNGTTISDYRSVEDKTGEFQNFLKVYGKKTCECGHEISRIKQAGRSTYLCEKCQK